MKFLLLLPLVLQPLARPTELLAEVVVELELRDGETMCSVHTRGATIEEILGEIARKSGRELSGLDESAKPEALPVWLDQRPLAYVVQTVAACRGYRARVGLSRIELEADLGKQDSAAAFDDQCSISYLRALRTHPEHALAAEGEMVLGEIQERHGNLRAANGHYQLVATRYPTSKETAEALLRSGTIQEHLGEWTTATQQFSALANLPQAHPHQARARLEMARCMSANGDGRQALFILDALDKIFPTTITSERQSRLYVRARALLAANRQGDALETLRQADDLGRNAESEAGAMELRAQALAHFGRNAESARAWLAFAQKSEGEARLRAWVSAAQQSLEAGDALGVLFVQRLAAGTRAASAIEAIAEEARKALGLAGEQALGADGDVLGRARQLFERNLTRQALLQLEPLYQRREERPAESRVELVLLYARTLAAEKELDPAIDVLRKELELCTTTPDKKRILAAAGELFEAAGRYDEAVRAFGGEL